MRCKRCMMYIDLEEYWKFNHYCEECYDITEEIAEDYNERRSP